MHDTAPENTTRLHAAFDAAPDASALSSRRGLAILLLLSLVQFMDVLDASILNIALPSIKDGLGFSQQSLQWVIDGYILTYGGFLLLGGRAADLLGRRRMLVIGLIVFAGSSLAGGLAQSSSVLVGARLAQGVGAALLSPAALSTLTSTFRSTRDRNTALGVWAAVSGIGGAAGVLFGGLLTQGPGGAGCSSSTSPSAPSGCWARSPSSSPSGHERGWPASTHSARCS
jgi:MFS family permease